MMHTHTHDKRPHFAPYLLASSISAILENIIFFPLDTTAKRLQFTTKPIPFSTTIKNNELKNILFPSTTTLHGAFASLYEGLLSSITYRIAQRNVMFTGQPMVDYWLHKKAGQTIENQFGKTISGPLIATIAGLATSLIEIPFLPFNTASVRMQTQHISFKQAVASGHLYNGSIITIWRNVIAATILFGGAAFARKRLFNIDTPRDASLTQEWLASSIGATLATTANNPLDLIKTRIQANNGLQTGWDIAKTTWIKEGSTGFMRGLIPRLLTVSPRTAFSMTITNQLVKKATELQSLGFFNKKSNKSITTDKESIQQRENKL